MLLTCGLLAAALGRLPAQNGDNIRTFYFPSRSFNIPFTLTERDPRIELLLNVSTDRRGYRYVGAARPQAGHFPFTAPADGEYSFIVQTREPNGVVTPADLRTAVPSLRVCVDTQAPVIEEFAAVASPQKLPSVRWKIVEANLKEIYLDYRPLGGDWVPQILPVQNEGTYTWKPSWSGELEVRMLAVDKADHRSQVRTLRLRTADNVSHMPPPQEPAGAAKVLFVNSKAFQLSYTLDDQTIGPSRVASVDIWKLHPGQNWQKCAEKGTPQGPATIRVDSAGRWGFRLIPRSGVGRAERDPKHGDAPDIWVEVDDQPPHVKITNVTVAEEGDAGYMTVYWKADDPFLRPMPITIKRATNAQAGDWVVVASELPNTGSWRQKTDDLKLGDRYEFVLKVEAVDEAGNIGSNQWGESVKVDLKVPRIKHIDVKPGGTMSGGGQETHNLPPAGTFGVNPLPKTQSTGRQPGSPLNGNGMDFRIPKQ